MGDDLKTIESTKHALEEACRNPLARFQTQVIYAEAMMVGGRPGSSVEASKPPDARPKPPLPPSTLSLEYYKRGLWGVTIEKPES